MNFNPTRVRNHLKNCNLEMLFVEELGWNTYRANITVDVDKKTYPLETVAEKQGVQIFAHYANDEVPNYPTRQKIEKQVTKLAREHLIIFVNADRTEQRYQWVARGPDKPIAYREYVYNTKQSGEALIQKLNTIMFTLDDEEGLDLLGTTIRLRDAFDRDRITKKFYDHFKSEHATFLKFIKGITEKTDQAWYASLMLNRLMFVYFIQKKGFLDGDRDYLKTRLQTVQQQKGKGKFHSFYQYFLIRLFHEGFGQQPPQRASDLDQLLGKVPYLNGGLFDPHELELKHDKIDIPDEAFENLFAFFDQYEWHLDARPLSNDKEINPDVLGYIFEKYINQKQMGAYYTKEDITEYISKNTIIPYLFDTAEKQCKVTFKPNSALWQLLRQDPDRYIYPAVLKGIDDPLPQNIAAGIKNVQKRTDWNRSADPDVALPTETWREHIARRQRALDLRNKLENGEIQNINDLITYNLNIRQFAEDVISQCEGPELLRAFYNAISSVTVLDPTCGSGAFLFAALNILEPLYETCLTRMQGFVDDLDRSGDRTTQKFSDFRKILTDVAHHPNRDYFIFKSIIVKNLYGVDIMDEAVEICKLRLFLKLVSQVETANQLEPLPDIDFNIRAGNTLVGFVSVEEIRHAAEVNTKGQGMLIFGETDRAIKKIEEDAEIVERAFQKFHEMQTQHDMDAAEFSEAKRELRNTLNTLSEQLDHYLALEYGIDPNKPKVYEKWRNSHQPFHWFAEFYGIMRKGGFDVIIGNPPYLEYTKVKSEYNVLHYSTLPTNNLYAFISERAQSLLIKEGNLGLILPNSSVSADKMESLREALRKQSVCWISNYAWRPSKLFEGANMLLAIWLLKNSNTAISTCFSTKYYRWQGEYRESLFSSLQYTDVSDDSINSRIAKSPGVIFHSIFDKCQKLSSSKDLSEVLNTNKGRYSLYYFRAVLYWFKVLTSIPIFKEDGENKRTGEMKQVKFQDLQLRDTVVALLSSNLYSLYYIVYSSCQVVNSSDFKFPLNLTSLNEKYGTKLSQLSRELMDDYEKNSIVQERHYSSRGRNFVMHKQYFFLRKSKNIVDKIDIILAEYYKFTDEELDFIINYDIKYRMGQDSEE